MLSSTQHLPSATTEGAPPLRLLFWESTSRCNLRCQHCRRLDTDDADAACDLDTAAAVELIDDVATMGRPIMVFSGGEPLTRPDLFTLIDRARLHGLPVALASNGWLIDHHMAERIAAHGVQRVAVSIDGADAATHDHLRGIPGSFDAARAALRRLRLAGVSTQINVTITRLNAHQREALYQLALDLEVDALHCFILVPVGCGAEFAPELRLSPGAQEHFLRWLHQKSENPHLFIKATCSPQYHRIMHQDANRRGITLNHAQHGMAATSKGCLAGSGVCFVSHNGAVFPCGYLPLEAGNLRHTRLSSIWRDSLLFSDLRRPERLAGRCGACEYQSNCGGCRARAFASSGDPFAEDPSCPYQPQRAAPINGYAHR